MRKTLMFTLVAFALSAGALSGCFGKDDEPGATNPTPTTPTDATPPTNQTPPTNETPPPPPKPADVNTTVTVTGSAGLTPIQPASGTASFTVPNEGWATFQITVTPTQFNADAVDVVVTDSAGTEVGRTTLSAKVPPTEMPDASTFDVTGAAPGDFTITATAHTIAGGFELACQISVTY